MDVILLEKVANLGNLGDRVSVRSGYARNFLLPKGKATLATASNIERFEARRAELEKQQAEILAAAQAQAAKLEGVSVQIARKAGVDGRLFGSVGNVDIADALKAQGIEIEKAMVRLPEGPFKAVGEHQVEIALHHDVVATVTVAVVGEQ